MDVLANAVTSGDGNLKFEDSGNFSNDIVNIVEVGQENIHDTTNLANTLLVTETSKSNGDDQVPTSYNKNADISSKD